MGIIRDDGETVVGNNHFRANVHQDTLTKKNGHLFPSDTGEIFSSARARSIFAFCSEKSDNIRVSPNYHPQGTRCKMVDLLKRTKVCSCSDT